MADIIQIRRDTYNNWIEVDPILAQAEFAVEIDTNQFKIGDGKEVYSALPYASQGVARPNPQDQDKWMVYNDASKSWAVATTDLIETNSTILFGNARGVFKDIIVPTLDTQLDVNRWLLDQIEEVYEGHFVKLTGDKMTGNLILDQAKNVKLETRYVDSGENSNLNLQHDGNTKVYIGGTEVAVAPYLQLNKEGIDDNHAVTKKYVDDKGNELQQEIIELEEEIDALAPTLERGSWRFNPTGSASPAMFALYAAGTPTNEYPQADQLFINTLDTDGNLHNFNDVVEGSYVEIFSPDDGDYGLYKVTSKSDETGGANAFWMFDIEHSRSNRPMADASLEDKCRFKFFTIADATNPDAFLLKSGDNMEGQLDMKGESGRNKIINLADPTQDYHAVNKKYVDALANGGTLGGQCIDINGGQLCASKPVTRFIDVIKNSPVWPAGDRYLETRPDKRPAYGNMTGYYRAAFNLGEHHYFVDTSYNIQRKHEKTDIQETVWTRPTLSTTYSWERMFGLNDDHTIMCDSKHYYKYGSDTSQYMKVYFHSTNTSVNDFNVSYGSHYGYKLETTSTAFTKDGMCFTTFIATNTSNRIYSFIGVTDTSNNFSVKSAHVYTKDITNLGGGSSGQTNDQFKGKHYVHRVGDELYVSTNESRDLWRFTGKAQNGQSISGFEQEFEKIENALPNTSGTGTIYIRYLPEVDRYYASCKYDGYLSKAGTGKELTSETFVNAIRFSCSNWEYTHNDKKYSKVRWSYDNLPLVFNGEVIVTANAMSESQDSITYSIGPSYLIYNGIEVKQYDGDYDNNGDADFNKEQFWSFPYRTNQPQNLPHYYQQTDVNTGETSLKCELQRYSQDKMYPNHQELIWNGVPVALNATEGQQVTKVSATRPIRGKLVVKKNQDSGINGTVVWAMKSETQLAGDYDNYNQLFLPNEWIIANAGIPDGCEAGVNSMVGTWLNTSKTVAVECYSTFGEPATRTYSGKDYDGILVRLSTTFKGDFHFNYEMPDAVTIMGELEEITQTVLT